MGIVDDLIRHDQITRAEVRTNAADGGEVIGGERVAVLLENSVHSVDSVFGIDATVPDATPLWLETKKSR